MTQPSPGPTVAGYFDVLIETLVGVGLKMGADLSQSDQSIQILGKALAATQATLVFTLGRVVPTLPQQYAADLQAVIAYAWPRSDGSSPPVELPAELPPALQPVVDILTNPLR